MADGQYHNILVPVDGSKVTAQVLEKGIAMAKACDAHLDILNVVQVTQLSDGYAPASSLSPDQTYDLVKTTQERLEDLKQRAIDAGVAKVDIHVRFGTPKQVIGRDFPKDHNNDLIVIGSTGLSAFERIVLGSVTGYVIRVAKPDVMVARTQK